jgi:four helix bundle protein
MRIRSFEDVLSWQKGRDLYVGLSRDFRESKDFSFKDQLFRTTLSITNNIAEGFDRGSDKELRQFLIIARGSCAEVRSMLHVALASEKITATRHEELVGVTISISKLLTAFIGSLATSDRRLETTQ